MLIRHSVAGCLLAITLMFAACSKTSSPSTPPVTPPSTPPPNQTTPVTGSLKINLTYPGYTPATNFELIVSEPGGNILLDTVAPWSAPVVATLKTNDTLLDVTTIFGNQGSPFTVDVYKSVNPSTFSYFNQNGYLTNPPVVRSGTPAEIFYDNIPAAVTTGYTYSLTTSAFMFTNYPYNGFNGSSFNPTNGTLQVNYTNYDSNYAYLIFPQTGLYNLHLQQNASDTVDLTHMDTAIAVTFNRTTPFTLNPIDIIFFGFPDTTTLTRMFDFTDILQRYSMPPGVDLEYPKIPVEKYELYVTATNSSNDGVVYYSYGNSVPQTLPFPVESNYSLSSNQPDNFTVSFPGPLPTSYMAEYSGANIRMFIWAPPDSGTLHPLSFLTSKNSKLLQNVSISDLSAWELSFEYDQGFNYASWVTYYNTPALYQKKLLTSSASLSKALH